jgi:hypothetical protein
MNTIFFTESHNLSRIATLNFDDILVFVAFPHTMKIGSSTVAFFLLFAPETAAFFAPVPPRETSGLFGYRQSYQYSLEQFTKTGKIEIDGKQVSLNDAAQKIDEDLQASQAQEAEAQQRLSFIQEQISDKVQEQAAEAREAEMQ